MQTCTSEPRARIKNVVPSKEQKSCCYDDTRSASRDFSRYGVRLCSGRTSRIGAQVVRINAELLHFHSTPPAPESSAGGVDPIGAKSAAQASVSSVTITEDRFIAILPSSGVCSLWRFLTASSNLEVLLSDVGFSLSSQAGKMASPMNKLFRGRLADETSSQDRDRNPGC